MPVEFNNQTGNALESLGNTFANLGISIADHLNNAEITSQSTAGQQELERGITDFNSRLTDNPDYNSYAGDNTRFLQNAWKSTEGKISNQGAKNALHEWWVQKSIQQEKFVAQKAQDVKLRNTLAGTSATLDQMEKDGNKDGIFKLLTEQSQNNLIAPASATAEIKLRSHNIDINVAEQAALAITRNPDDKIGGLNNGRKSIEDNPLLTAAEKKSISEYLVSQHRQDLTMADDEADRANSKASYGAMKKLEEKGKDGKPTFDPAKDMPKFTGKQAPEEQKAWESYYNAFNESAFMKTDGAIYDEFQGKKKGMTELEMQQYRISLTGKNAYSMGNRIETDWLRANKPDGLDDGTKREDLQRMILSEADYEGNPLTKKEIYDKIAGQKWSDTVKTGAWTPALMEMYYKKFPTERPATESKLKEYASDDEKEAIRDADRIDGTTMQEKLKLAGEGKLSINDLGGIDWRNRIHAGQYTKTIMDEIDKYETKAQTRAAVATDKQSDTYVSLAAELSIGNLSTNDMRDKVLKADIIAADKVRLVNELLAGPGSNKSGMAAARSIIDKGMLRKNPDGSTISGYYSSEEAARNITLVNDWVTSKKGNVSDIEITDYASTLNGESIKNALSKRVDDLTDPSKWNSLWRGTALNYDAVSDFLSGVRSNIITRDMFNKNTTIHDRYLDANKSLATFLKERKLSYDDLKMDGIGPDNIPVLFSPNHVTMYRFGFDMQGNAGVYTSNTPQDDKSWTHIK